MIRPKKGLGQNFLQDENIIRKIVNSLDAPTDAPVIEIGPGLGALTKYLIESHQNFTAIEIDERSVDFLQKQFPSLKIIHRDILKTDWETLLEKDERLFVIGNLPYYITSQILFSMLDKRHLFDRAILMMQLEVAERIIAKPHTKSYGILSVLTQTICTPKILFKVSPNVFYPRPDVQSAVLRLDFNRSIPSTLDWFHLKDVVRTAFNQRRKTLSNSLKKFSDIPSDIKALRAEALSPAAFVSLAQKLSEQLG